LHCASEAGGFRGPIAAQLVHNRSKQGANEERPATRPMTTRNNKKAHQGRKKSKKDSKKAKTDINDNKIIRDPKKRFYPHPSSGLHCVL
jgi:hypothetical protein